MRNLFYKKLLISTVAASMLFGSVISANAAQKDLFDAQYYAETYPDVAAAVGNDEDALLQHYLNYGIAEGRSANAYFNTLAYRNAYADLDEAFGDDLDAYADHYIAYGVSEQRNTGGERTITDAEYAAAAAETAAQAQETTPVEEATQEEVEASAKTAEVSEEAITLVDTEVPEEQISVSATTVSGNDIPAVINETIVDIPQVTPSSTATVTISLVETLSSDSAKFRLDYDLGTYTHQSGEARNEYPVSLFIESISWDKESFIIATYDYDNLVGSSSGSFEFTLNNLVNDTYTFYVTGISDSKYYGTFTVDFVVDDLTSMAQGIVIYSDEVPVVTFTGYPDSSVADGTVVTMTMNTGELPCTMRMNGRTLGNSAYGTSFEFTVSRNDTYYYDAISQSGVVTKGTLVIDFFDESASSSSSSASSSGSSTGRYIDADDPLNKPLLDSLG